VYSVALELGFPYFDAISNMFCPLKAMLLFGIHCISQRFLSMIQTLRGRLEGLDVVAAVLFVGLV
jgi:hypothetical protein